ncbi:MAG TPA: PfkB family carbohydrate kinase [Acidobacteriaceae bacterium]|nr:PfkB family carbohydrate kinase [Acidobacteriaceae bacterium]
MNYPKSLDLVGVGLNATDTLIRLSEFPQRGSKLEYDAESLMPGGQVASTVVACQTWGLRTRYVGKLGDDDASRLHGREFDRTGVEAKLINVKGAASPKSLIMVDPEGERTVLCRRDERLILQPEELRRDWITDARALHVDGHDTAAAIQAASWAREAGLAVIADLDEIYPGVDALIEKIDYLIVSRDFPARLTGERNLVKALREIQARYGCQLTAATLGPGGVLAWNGESVHYAPAYRVPVVDTTGAGDIFHAGFIFALLHGWPLERQLDFACAAAAMNCMAEGARGGISSVDSILNFMQTTPHYDESVEQVLQTELSF